MGNAFLKRLHKEGVLQLVTPSEEMGLAYQKKSESHIVSARLLLDNDLFERSVSMAYYSMYYSVMALFFATGIKCENHTAAIILLKEIFAFDNADIEHAKTERIDKQYYVTSAPVREDVVALIRTAESFNAELRDVADRLTGQKIAQYRKRLGTLI
jgi:uncharacterized protein (UPF0332 family)